jgi:hypothetical protein
MKKAILSTSLKLIPKAMQYKALTKALNYLFREQMDMVRFDGMVVSFKLTDIRRVWSFQYDGREFRQQKNKKSPVDVTCALRSEVALVLHSKQEVIRALEQGDIKLAGEPEYIEAVVSLLLGLQPSKVDSLVNHLRSFLRLKPVDREPKVFSSALQKRAMDLEINLHAITADQVNSQEAVDLVRDAALSLEKTDLTEALRLMNIAKQKRPSGPVICRKVEEYQTLLNL